MAKSAVLEVEVTLSVHAQLEAEDATPQELRRFVEREPEMVRAAVAKAVRAMWREVGWLDEDRAVFISDVFDADPVAKPSDAVTVCR